MLLLDGVFPAFELALHPVAGTEDGNLFHQFVRGGGHGLDFLASKITVLNPARRHNGVCGIDIVNGCWRERTSDRHEALKQQCILYLDAGYMRLEFRNDVLMERGKAINLSHRVKLTIPACYYYTNGCLQFSKRLVPTTYRNICPC